MAFGNSECIGGGGGGGSLAWNSECTGDGGGGLLGLEFQMHEGVSSPGIPKGGGELKTLIY